MIRPREHLAVPDVPVGRHDAPGGSNEQARRVSSAPHRRCARGPQHGDAPGGAAATSTLVDPRGSSRSPRGARSSTGPRTRRPRRSRRSRPPVRCARELVSSVDPQGRWSIHGSTTTSPGHGARSRPGPRSGGGRQDHPLRPSRLGPRRDGGRARAHGAP